MSTARTHFVEAAVGLIVVVAAILMLIFFLGRAGGAGSDSIEVTAVFPNVGGIEVGTDVRVAGMTIGRVTDIVLDTQMYQAEVRMAIDGSARLPNDSSAAITSESLLGGSFIALLPGGSTDPLANGDTILDTQGAVDMTGLIGSMINGSDNAAPANDDGFDTMADDFPAANAP